MVLFFDVCYGGLRNDRWDYNSFVECWRWGNVGKGGVSFW